MASCVSGSRENVKRSTRPGSPAIAPVAIPSAVKSPCRATRFVPRVRWPVKLPMLLTVMLRRPDYRCENAPMGVTSPLHGPPASGKIIGQVVALATTDGAEVPAKLKLDTR